MKLRPLNRQKRPGTRRQTESRTAATETPNKKESSAVNQSTRTYADMTDAETGYVTTTAPEWSERPVGEVLTNYGRHDEHVLATAAWEYEGVSGTWAENVRLKEYATDEKHAAHLHLSAKAGDSIPFGARLWMMDAFCRDISIRFASLDDAEEFGHWIAREAKRLQGIAEEVEM